MGDKLIKTGETKKSETFENDNYKFTLRNGGFVNKINDISKPWYDDQVEIGEYFEAPLNIMTIQNKETGKKTNKWFYQGNPIEDIENDLSSKKKFGALFDKIDQ